MSDANIYRLHPISPESKCIRVLDILPVAAQASNPDDEPIRSVLRTVNLDDQPQFTALSYVWGNDPPTPQYFVSFEEAQAQVTANCYSALRHLRKKLGQFTIWVGAVCINQADVAEKSQQIPLMGDIYGLADLVYIWLGEGTSGTDRAMQYLARDHLGPYIKSSNPIAAAWYFVMSTKWSYRSLPIPLSGDGKPRSRKAAYTNRSDLSELFSRPWIGRVWTYQEVLLASRPILVCGDFHVCWMKVENHLRLFDIMRRRVIPHTRLSRWRSVLLGRVEVNMDQSARQSPSSSAVDDVFFMRLLVWSHVFLILELAPMSLFVGSGCILAAFADIPGWASLVIPVSFSMVFLTVIVPNFLPNGALMTLQFPGQSSIDARTRGLHDTAYDSRYMNHALWTRQCHDSRDMAFGMWAVLEKRAATRLEKPNYTQHVGDVYRSFTRHLGQLTGSVHFLVYAAVQNYGGQPSWVPNWASYKNNDWGYNFTEPRLTDDWGSCASDPEILQRQKAYFRMESQDSVLTVHAYELAIISTCFKSQKISSKFLANEESLHLNNTDILNWPSARTLVMLTTDAPKSRWDREKFFLLWPWRMLMWKIILYYCRNKSKSEILDMLRNLSKPYHPFRSIFRLYTDCCQGLAKNRQAVFFASRVPSAAAKHLCHGVCLEDLQVGDRIVRIKVLWQLLLVRANYEMAANCELATAQKGPNSRH